LPPKDEWDSRSRQQEHQENQSKDGGHIQRLARDAPVRTTWIPYICSHFNWGNSVFIGMWNVPWSIVTEKVKKGIRKEIAF
jgi:hypothetical protein